MKFRLKPFCIAFALAFLGAAASHARVTAASLSFYGPEEVPAADATTALIMVDVQHDFLPKGLHAARDGSLAVKNGDEVIEPLRKAAELMKSRGGLVTATQDWHPSNHISFKSQNRGGVWPDHCIQNSYGAEVVPEISSVVSVDFDGPWITQKGTNVDHDAYSGFDGTQFAARLHAKGIKTVWIGGVATDYCVRATALDALKAGFRVFLLVDASRGVEITPGDINRALLDVQSAGGVLVKGSR